MKCNLKAPNPIRFGDLQIGDVFVEKGYETICIKIDTLFDEGDSNYIIEAIDLTSGQAWLITETDAVFKLNAELNAEYV